MLTGTTQQTHGRDDGGTASVLLAIGHTERCDRVVDALANGEHGVTTVDSIADARALLGEQYFEAVVADDDLPDGDALDLLADVRPEQPDVACFLYTAVEPPEIDTASRPALVVNYVDARGRDAVDTLVAEVKRAIQRRTHTSYPLPSDETERLAVLEKYLDVESDAEVAFDRLAHIAKIALKTDVALVGLVGRHTENVLACRGVNWNLLDREETVCTYGVLADGPTVVENLTEDPRFERHDLVTEDDLQSYAGAPLVTPDGYRVGMFCVLDEEPRSYDEEELNLLVALAEETMDQLELRGPDSA